MVRSHAVNVVHRTATKSLRTCVSDRVEHFHVSSRHASMSPHDRPGVAGPPRASGHQQRVEDGVLSAIEAVSAAARTSRGGIYLGGGRSSEWVWSGAEHSTLVLGPSRSGKTSSLVIPNVLAAQGAVATTSTKPDVLRATAHAGPRSAPPCSSIPPVRSKYPRRYTRGVVTGPLQLVVGWCTHHGERNGRCNTTKDRQRRSRRRPLARTLLSAARFAPPCRLDQFATHEHGADLGRSS